MNDLNSDNIITIPSVNDQNECITPEGNIIYNCIIQDNGDIKGITSDGTKALYRSKNNKWFFGSEIGYSNLIPLNQRKESERQEIRGKALESYRDNLAKKRNIQEVAKALLDSMVSDKVINQYIEHPEAMQGKTGADLLIHAMMEQAIKSGNYHAAEFVRDTAGYKPKNDIQIQADIMTDADKALIDKAYKTG